MKHGWRHTEQGAAIVLANRLSSDFLLGCNRTRFSVAHELGHLVFRRLVNDCAPGFAWPRVDPYEERFCNEFAAHLLLPIRAFPSDLDLSGLSPTQLLRLGAKYQVSLKTLLIRMTQLRKDAGAIIWEQTGRRWVASWATDASVTGASTCLEPAALEAVFVASGAIRGGLGYIQNRKRHRIEILSCRLNNRSVLSIVGRGELLKQWDRPDTHLEKAVMSDSGFRVERPLTLPF